MRKFFRPMGSVSRLTIESQALRSNMLDDPSVRVVDVYIPAGHDGQGLSLLVDLVGFTSSGLSQTDRVGFRENLPERLDRLIGERRKPPVSCRFPIASPGSRQPIHQLSFHRCLEGLSAPRNALLRLGACRDEPGFTQRWESRT
jgi:hypothetical protein